MSTQTRASGGGRSQKKSNSTSGGGGGDASTHATVKKTDASKTEKEKVQPKPTAEQLRIAQITSSNTPEDPQMSMKVSMLLDMTQRSEEEVCCALNECDYDMEAAVLFLLESLPVGAFEKSSKKKKNKAANVANDGAGGDGDWADSNTNADKREKSRNRSSNRGGRGGTDSRGWRGREARENERNQRDSRGGDRGDDRGSDNRGGQRSGGGGRNGTGGGRGGGYIGRSGRGGGRMGGRGAGGRGDRGAYGSRNNANDDHQEVELWDNTIAQNAEKQQHQTHDDAWGDWNNEEYEGSLKDSKVFTTSNLPNQTAASVVSGGLASNSGGGGVGGGELSAPPGLEHHLGTSVMGGTGPQQGSHLNALVGNAVAAGSGDDSSNAVNTNLQSVSTTTPMMQYSTAVSNPAPQTQQQQQQSSISGSNVGSAALNSTQYNSTDTFSNAASAAATLVQQVQQQQQQQQAPLKSSATLSAEQSQYFNSLTSQNTAGSVQPPTAVGYAQNASFGQNSTAVQYPTSYANVFGSASSGSVVAPNAVDQSQLTSNSQQPQVRRARAKLPPPSKIPSSAVEMPGDNTLNNIGYLDVQFGGLDFGTDDSFDALPEKFNSAVTIESQQKQQDVPNDYQNKSVQQQQSQSSLAGNQISDALSSGAYTQRTAAQQQQHVSGGPTVGSVSNALDQLTKNDPYNQSNVANNAAGGYQNTYQTNSANKTNNAYQQTAAQAYNASNYSNVQSSVPNSYQQQTYGSYQQNSVNSYQQQQQQQQQSGVNVQNATGAGSGAGGVNSTQNIPVGGSASQSNVTANSNAGYLSSGYSTQQSSYQQSQSVYGNTGLSNSSGFAGSTNNSASQYSNFSASAKLKDSSAATSTSHYESVSSNSGGSAGNAPGSVTSSGGNSGGIAGPNANNNSANVSSQSSSQSVVSGGGAGGGGNVSGSQSNSSVQGTSSNNNVAGTISGGTGVNNNNSAVSAAVAQTAGSAAAAAAVLSSLTNKNSGGGSSSSTSVSGGAGSGGGGVGSGATGAGGTGSSGGSGTGAGAGGGGMVPTNIQMVSQYIQTGLPYYQQPVYSYEELQMMQQRVPHVQGYYDLNYTPTSLGAGRDNLGSVAYSTMTDGRFARTDNNSSPVSNVSSTMSQQAGSSGPMLNVPYAYFYGGNVMPGGFQYGTPAIYPQQIPAANTASGGQFPKPSYNTGYGSTSYDTLSQATQDYTKGGYSSNVNQPNKTQNVTNQPQSGTGSDITSSMYSKGHVALNKVNSYEKQNYHSGTPPPFNMPNTQNAGGTSAQPYGMYLQMPAAGHHNMIHQPIHQDSNSTGQRQQTSSQSKSAAKQGYSPSYWAAQN